jgi:antitoxin component of MazEF toxin-antitoxin module
MLKKLVKYGNSNALILDRAILELLNISEGSVVKLHTDGKSLIITPEKTVAQEEISMTGTEIIQDYVQTKKSSAQDAMSKEYPSLAEGTEGHLKMQEAVKKIMEKYSDALTGYDHHAFLAEVDVLAEKYEGNKLSPAFLEEVKMLQAKYSPRLAAMHKEMSDLL